MLAGQAAGHVCKARGSRKRCCAWARRRSYQPWLTRVPSHVIPALPPACPQVKRIHEYKRQFMNAISIIYRYKKIKEMSPEERKKVGILDGQGRGSSPSIPAGWLTAFSWYGALASLPASLPPCLPAHSFALCIQPRQVVPRVCIFGGKAASAYYMAKKIVALLVSGVGTSESIGMGCC